MRPITLNFPSGNALLTNQSGCITFFAGVETTGTASAEYQLWDGTNTTGPLMVDVTLLAGQSARDYIHKHHLSFKVGLYYVAAAGSVRGSVTALLGCMCGHREMLMEYAPEVLQTLPSI